HRISERRSMTERRVAIVAGARTPFAKAGKAFASLGPLALAKHAVYGLLERHHVDPAEIEALAFGVVVPDNGTPHLAHAIHLHRRRALRADGGLLLHQRAARGNDHRGRGRAGPHRLWDRRRSRVALGGRPSNLPRADDRTLDGRAHGDYAPGVEDPARASGRSCAREPPKRRRR